MRRPSASAGAHSGIVSSAGQLSDWFDAAFRALRPAARPVSRARVAGETLHVWTTQPDWFTRDASATTAPGTASQRAGTDRSPIDVILAPHTHLPAAVQFPPTPGAGPRLAAVWLNWRTGPCGCFGTRLVACSWPGQLSGGRPCA